MALLNIKTSDRIDTSIRLEKSTAEKLEQYARFMRCQADQVVNEALEYVFAKDREFQEFLEKNPVLDGASTLRVKRTPNGAGTNRKARAQRGSSTAATVQ